MAVETTKDETDTDNAEKGQQNGKAHMFPQVRCAFAASLGLFISGTVGGWTGASLTNLDTDFNMTATNRSLVVSLASYGSLVGSLLAGKVVDIFGRKKMMFAMAPAVALGYVLIGIATNIYLVYAGRFVCGFSSGILFPSCFIYTSETCQGSLRGRLGSLSIVSLTLGILTSYILGGLSTWRSSALLCIIPACILLIILFFIPESPYWYLLKKNSEAAADSLKRVRGPNYNIKNEMEAMIRKISDVGENINYKELFKRRTRIPLLVALLAHTIQQLCGGNIIITYTSFIFEQAQSSIDARMATIYTGVAQLTGTIVSIFLIDRYGRRILLALSVSLCGIFISIFGGYYLALSSKAQWPAFSPLSILFCYLFSYCLGCRSVPWLIGSEVFNTSVRSRANSLSLFYNRVLSLLILQVYPYIQRAVGEAPIFLSYGVLCFSFAVGTLLLIPETKGKSLEEIQEYFERKALKGKEPNERMKQRKERAK